MSATSNNPPRDLFDREIGDPTELELLRIYRSLERLAGSAEIPPCALMNVRQAMVMMWNACHDLDLIYEEPEHG